MSRHLDRPRRGPPRGPAHLTARPDGHPHVILLGTSAARPTVRRNVSGLLLKTGDATVLLDCGEGTLRQLLKYAPGSNVDAVLLSHLHADHFLGIPGLLGHAPKARPNTIFAPVSGAELVAEAVQIAGPEREEITVHGVADGDVVRLPGMRIRAFATDHASGSVGYAVRLEGERGNEVSRKVVYTGDTRPTSTTIGAARSAEFLVHEATFAREDARRARKTRHSTAQEAARVAREAGVRHLVLTHISARLDARPWILKREAREVFPDTTVGKDGIKIEVGR